MATDTGPRGLGTENVGGGQRTSLDRQTLIDRAKRKRDFSVVIIGGGINGAGTFRDLSMQDIDCLIVDKGDFCAGTSGASSRVIHGGLKYLETGEFRLVRESTIERNRLLRNAPHVVRLLEIVLLYKSWVGGTYSVLRRFFGRTAPLGGRGALIVEIGLWLFDLLGLRERATPRHRFLSREALRDLLPEIENGVLAGAFYYDAAIQQPERLGLELILDAMDENKSCVALNYVSLTSARGGTLQLRDEIAGVTFEVTPKVVVNTTGAWIDCTNKAMELDTRYIRGTKGSHLVLQQSDLLRQLACRMVSFDAHDGRECFAYPVLDRILVGTTDLYVGDPDNIRCEDHEIDYLLAALRAAFPSIVVSSADIVFAYSGVRPLPNVAAGDPSQVTRDHVVRLDERAVHRPYPILSLIGGKWTTFRAAAEKTANGVLRQLRRPRHISTRGTCIGGGRNFPTDATVLRAMTKELSIQFGISPERVQTLIERYGSGAAAIASHCSQEHDPQIVGDSGYTRREISHIAATEMVTRLADVLMRRTTIAMRGRVTKALVIEVAEVVGEVLGWDPKRMDYEIGDAISKLCAHLGLAK